MRKLNVARLDRSLLHYLQAGAIALLLSCGGAAQAGASELNVGGLVVLKPKYEGSDRYEVVGVPFAYPGFASSNSGVFGVYGADDVRLRLLNYNGFEAGILGGVAFGREEEDGPLLRGLGDLDTGVIAGAWVGYRTGDTLFSVSYHEILSGHSGGYGRASVRHTFHLAPNLKVRPRIGVTVADDRYMEEYFGITTAQALSSAAMLPTYAASAGFKDAFVGLTTIYDIDRRWTLRSDVEYKGLLGDAADSPIVETESQWSASLGLTYRFQLD